MHSAWPKAASTLDRFALNLGIAGNFAQKCRNFRAARRLEYWHSSSPQWIHGKKRLRCSSSRVRRQSTRLNAAALKARTLAIAFARALADAETLAVAAGLKQGYPGNISMAPQRALVLRAMNRDAPVAMSAEIAPCHWPGQLSVTSSVSVIFTATP